MTNTTERREFAGKFAPAPTCLRDIWPREPAEHRPLRVTHLLTSCFVPHLRLRQTSQRSASLTAFGCWTSFVITCCPSPPCRLARSRPPLTCPPFFAPDLHLPLGVFVLAVFFYGSFGNGWLWLWAVVGWSEDAGERGRGCGARAAWTHPMHVWSVWLGFVAGPWSWLMDTVPLLGHVPLRSDRALASTCRHPLVDPACSRDPGLEHM